MGWATSQEKKIFLILLEKVTVKGCWTSEAELVHAGDISVSGCKEYLIIIKATFHEHAFTLCVRAR